MILLAMCCGFVLDLLFADPEWIIHPVVIMGRCISALEYWLRMIFPKTPRGERIGGAVLAVLLPTGTLLITGGACFVAAKIHPGLEFALQTLWSWQVLAMRGLHREGQNVYRCLTTQGLPQARQAVSRIVGRDTQALSREGVVKAAVETIAENFSDGVFAPMLYFCIGGAPLALTYKAVNTMDSMIGYKNETYRYFGTAAAKLDDAANFLPSRLSALLWIASSALCGFDGGRAWRMWRRDARNHASPNSAQTESACAGALGIQLAGPSYYFGEYYDKPTIGDALRSPEPEDIVRAGKILYAAGTIGLLLCAGGRILMMIGGICS